MMLMAHLRGCVTMTKHTELVSGAVYTVRRITDFRRPTAFPQPMRNANTCLYLEKTQVVPRVQVHPWLANMTLTVLDGYVCCLSRGRGGRTRACPPPCHQVLHVTYCMLVVSRELASDSSSACTTVGIVLAEACTFFSVGSRF